MLSFPIDFLGLLLLLFLSLFVSWSAVGHLNEGQWKESILLYLMLYYLAFVIFSDGNTEGWSHSVGVVGKLKMTLIYIANSITSIYVPFIIVGISIIHLRFLRSHIVDTEQNVAEKVQP